MIHDGVIKWKDFARYRPFVPGIRPPLNSPHKGQWRGALLFSLICTWTNSWVNNREAGVLRRHRGHWYYVIVMFFQAMVSCLTTPSPYLLQCCHLKDIQKQHRALYMTMFPLSLMNWIETILSLRCQSLFRTWQRMGRKLVLADNKANG